MCRASAHFPNVAQDDCLVEGGPRGGAGGAPSAGPGAERIGPSARSIGKTSPCNAAQMRASNLARSPGRSRAATPWEHGPAASPRQAPPETSVAEMSPLAGRLLSADFARPLPAQGMFSRSMSCLKGSASSSTARKVFFKIKRTIVREVGTWSVP